MRASSSAEGSGKGSSSGAGRPTAGRFPCLELRFERDDRELPLADGRLSRLQLLAQRLELGRALVVRHRTRLGGRLGRDVADLSELLLQLSLLRLDAGHALHELALQALELLGRLEALPPQRFALRLDVGAVVLAGRTPEAAHRS